MIYRDDNIHDAMEKIAGAQADAYRAGKPKLLASLNARTVTEMRQLGGQYKAHRLSRLAKGSPLGLGLRVTALPKRLVQLHDASIDANKPRPRFSPEKAALGRERIKSLSKARAAKRARLLKRLSKIR